MNPLPLFSGYSGSLSKELNMNRLLSFYFALALSLIPGIVVYAADVNTELMDAIRTKNIQKVRATISTGANVNTNMDTTNQSGITPLMATAASPDAPIEIGKLLLEKGAKVNAKDWLGWTALMYASYYGQTELAKLLMNKGAEVNAKSNTGWTALMYAAYTGQIEIGKLLIENGADVSAKTREGETALSIALSRDESGFAELLR
jgi:ankyrin repeat protein